jgi:quercetin dioxygenase-like cupin family protein
LAVAAGRGGLIVPVPTRPENSPAKPGTIRQRAAFSALGHTTSAVHSSISRGDSPRRGPLRLSLNDEELPTMQTVAAPYITAYEHSKDYLLVGSPHRILAEASKTDGQLALLHVTVPYGNATPLHIHRTHDEAFFVLHGEIRGVLGDAEWSASGGAFVWLPRGVAHAFQGVSEIPAEVLVMSVPGGFDAFVADAGEPFRDGETPTVALDPALLTEIAARHDIDIVGPPVNFLG